MIDERSNFYIVLAVRPSLDASGNSVATIRIKQAGLHGAGGNVVSDEILSTVASVNHFGPILTVFSGERSYRGVRTPGLRKEESRMILSCP